jgi:hypothetical protein
MFFAPKFERVKIRAAQRFAGLALEPQADFPDEI